MISFSHEHFCVNIYATYIEICADKKTIIDFFKLKSLHVKQDGLYLVYYDTSTGNFTRLYLPLENKDAIQIYQVIRFNIALVVNDIGGLSEIEMSIVKK